MFCHSPTTHRRTRLLGVALTFAVGVIAGSAPTHAATKSAKPPKAAASKGAIDPNAPEVNSAGDIPDNIAYVPYKPAAGGFTITTPEGWSRRDLANGAVFTDKYNIVQAESFTGQSAPTPASASAAVGAKFAKSKGFRLGKASTVKRKSGTAVLVTYVIGSTPNEVTGKTIPVAVERYEFFRRGTSVVLTLSGAKGADNVDPWKIVTNSFTWA